MVIFVCLLTCRKPSIWKNRRKENPTDVRDDRTEGPVTKKNQQIE